MGKVSNTQTGTVLIKELSDKDILDLFRKNNNEGFRVLVSKYREKLYFHIRRIVILHEDADDALQNTFLKAWKNLENFRSDSSLYTWLYRISTNEALLILKKRKKEKSIIIEDLNTAFTLFAEGDAWFDGDETEKKLRNAILKLPEKQGLVFNLKYYDEMKYEEMSEILKTSVGALKASYHHAVKKIKNSLSGD